MAKIEAFEDKGRGVTATYSTHERPNGKGVTYAYRTKEEHDGNGKHYRIDFSYPIQGHWLPWEACNDTRYETLAEAQAAIIAHDNAWKEDS